MIGSIPIRWVPFLVAGCWLLVMMAMLVAGTYSGCVRLVRSSSGYLSGVACFRLVVELVALAWLLSSVLYNPMTYDTRVLAVGGENRWLSREQLAISRASACLQRSESSLNQFSQENNEE
ncbi:hypothetical protein FPQ18DRAFT_414484 [Pyronema domesticum]|nr:hypothetical protein FPQ18DRAFT_414484 [Pyronema domesticum]